MTKEQGKRSSKQQTGNAANLKIELNEYKREDSGRAYINELNKLEKKLCSSLQNVYILTDFLSEHQTEVLLKSQVRYRKNMQR